jgi:hypothetical protein
MGSAWSSTIEDKVREDSAALTDDGSLALGGLVLLHVDLGLAVLLILRGR